MVLQLRTGGPMNWAGQFLCLEQLKPLCQPFFTCPGPVCRRRFFLCAHFDWLVVLVSSFCPFGSLIACFFS